MAGFSIAMLRHSARWAAPEIMSREIEGFPKDRIFNWREGYEVLHFINRYMEYKGWASQITFQKLESLLKTRLPFTARTHYDVMIWLDTNFKK
ncbi:hypothetical protein [Flavobacterium psychrotrophum]|uniref:hypothetical protein n=1 Tax=Flavobacterium psychrotrophum TaxID=2294119 RepID=UPI000E318B81|nr:hypothetical protein [Flavobacterium psychrotrophum]